MPKLLELFAGTHTLSDVFKAHGWETYTVDWDEKCDVDLHADIGELSMTDIKELCGGFPDVIWASPDCTTYSVAALGKHRRKVGDELVPITDYARQCDNINRHVVALIIACEVMKKVKEHKPFYYFIENPRGAMRKMPWLEGLPRYTVTYCQYGEDRMKPTDIWTNHPFPNFKPPCKNGDPCHVRAPRGARTGTQGIDGKLTRAKLPIELCEHVQSICSGPTLSTNVQTRMGDFL